MLPRHALLAAMLFAYLSGDKVLGMCTPNIVYGPLNASVTINIPGIKLMAGDIAKWTKNEKQLIAKSSPDKTVTATDFNLFSNGTLQVTRLLERKTQIAVEVHNNQGIARKTCSFTLIGIVPLSKPMINHTCNAMSLEFSCRVAHGAADTLEVLMNGKRVAEGKSATTVTGSISIDVDTSIPLKCVAENNVSKESQEDVFSCPKGLELDILLISCIVGAAVVFIVFMLLLIYCALRCCEQRHRRQISEAAVELPSMRTSHEARHRRLPDPRNPPTRPPQHHPQPQPRHQQQQQRKRTQHKMSSHKKMDDQPTMQQKMLQGQAVPQENRLQSQAVSQQNRLQGQAVSQQNRLQGQAVSEPNMLQGQTVPEPNMLQGQAVSQQKMVQGQAMSQQKRQQGQPVPPHMVQVFPTPQQQKTQGKLASQHKQLPELPPHHPSSVSQETTPRPLPHAQPKPPPHRIAERQQHA